MGLDGPPSAPLLMLLSTSMLYFGMASGGAVGGAVSGSLGPSNLASASAPFACAGLFTLWINARNTAALEAPARHAG